MKRRSSNKLTEALQTRRDNILADYLFNHKGAENAVPKHEIAEYLAAQGYPTKDYSVGNLVRRIAEQRHLPICAINGKGYFWAASKADVQATIADLESRMAALAEHRDRLKAFVLE
jgi:hypothetical protein